MNLYLIFVYTSIEGLIGIGVIVLRYILVQAI